MAEAVSRELTQSAPARPMTNAADRPAGRLPTRRPRSESTSMPARDRRAGIERTIELSRWMVLIFAAVANNFPGLRHRPVDRGGQPRARRLGRLQPRGDGDAARPPHPGSPSPGGDHRARPRGRERARLSDRRLQLRPRRHLLHRRDREQPALRTRRQHGLRVRRRRRVLRRRIQRREPPPRHHARSMRWCRDSSSSSSSR